MDFLELLNMVHQPEHLEVENDVYSIFTTRVLPKFVYSVTVLKPNQTTRGHTHSHPEQYCFRDGRVVLTVGETKYLMQQGDKTIVAPNLFHQVSNTTNEPKAFLCIWSKDMEQTSKY